MTSSKRPYMALTFVCLVGFVVGPVLAQEKIPGVPAESEYYYRIHYGKVEEIMKNPDLSVREKQLTAFMKGLDPKSKILKYMPAYFTQIADAYAKAGKEQEAKALKAKIRQLFPQTVNPAEDLLKAFEAKNYAKSIQLGEKIYAGTPDKQVAFILFTSYRATNNPAKAAVYAAKVVDGFGSKDGIQAVIFLAHYHVNQRALQKGSVYCKQMLAAYPSSPPPGYNAQQWNGEKSFATIVRATDAYTRKDYAAAIRNYTNSLNFNAKNDEAYFRIGMSQWNLNKLDLAMDAFAKTVALGQRNAGKAKEYLEQIYKPSHHNTLNGLDELLAKAKAEINP